MSCSITSARHMRLDIPLLSKGLRLDIGRELRGLSSTCLRLERAPKAASIGRNQSKLQDKLAERDLFLSILSASTTKRDAKSYLSRYTESERNGQATATKSKANSLSRSLRIALIKIRAPQTLSDTILQGLAHTLSQLSLLGLSCVFVIDCEEEDTASQRSSASRQYALAQAQRVVKAMENEASVKARLLDCALGVDTKVFLQYPEMILSAIENSLIPVVPAIAHTVCSQRVVLVEPDDVVLALTAGLVTGCDTDEHGNLADTDTIPSSTATSPHTATIERIILLDPLGGFPSPARQHKSHVFINILQEYEDVRQELSELQGVNKPIEPPLIEPNPPQHASSPGSASSTGKASSLGPHIPSEERTPRKHRYIKNLDLLQKTLALLPLSASALLTTPEEAATSTHTGTDLGVITRRPKNPLIFNLLTDKPIVSSSLPEVRLGRDTISKDTTSSRHRGSTFVKYGMPLAIVPDTRTYIWAPPNSSVQSLSLENLDIDLPRLVDLIEDSFGRLLNTEHYLNRIRGKLAGVIIAGDYDGGAILTWELPPGVPDDGSESSRQRMVPYLDKFAVLRKSQGTGGVADIVFTAMVRTCFPNGVCWRSRKDNPVNKWYFERANGTWKIPETQWTMFWTTPELTEDRQRFLDYENVCRSVQPSWADHNKPAD